MSLKKNVFKKLSSDNEIKKDITEEINKRRFESDTKTGGRT